MSNFISGIQQRVNDAANTVSDVAHGNMPANTTNGSDAPHQDIGKGMSDMGRSVSGFQKQHQKDQEAARQAAGEGEQGKSKKSGMKKMMVFVKSMFGYGNAAKKGGSAVEELTGDSLNPFAQRGTA